MTKTTIFTALRLALSLATAGPAHAGGTDLAPPNAIVLVHRAHSHLRTKEHATIQRPQATRSPDREEDPLAMMHFE
ncbi:hypothetical protein [Bradyrhizobium sp.]|jgi:hypothetical protein|uniref:hypothetical protein n=1 Tax=Bradyrhizobium sp. TaxID=376 RepID=UPI002DDCDF2C|nr:hypothetical protein [Bradyrhizobium sp.]HEV2160379.1 hypothetical protein [Bradyrhizobium sp.]